MTGGFQVGPYQTNFQQESIGLAEEIPGIGLARPPVDIVIQSPHWMPFSVRPFGKFVPDRMTQKQDSAELREMKLMYDKWRSA